MERLTKKSGDRYLCAKDGKYCSDMKKNPKDPDCCCKCDVRRSMDNRLGHWEDMKFSGRMTFLKVKPGEMVFVPSRMFPSGKTAVDVREVEEVKIRVRLADGETFDMEDIGTCVFLTREEAENALKEPEEEK